MMKVLETFVLTALVTLVVVFMFDSVADGGIDV